MNELEENSDSLGAADAARAGDVKADTASETSVNATNKSDKSAASSVTTEAAASNASDGAKPANIVLYSPARAKATAPRAWPTAGAS